MRISNYRTYSILLCSFLITNFVLLSCSPIRKINSSSRKTPEWIHGIPKESIVAFGTAPTHEEAKKKALDHVKEEIIRSVAVQVTYNVTSVTTEDINSFIEQYSSTTNIQSDYFEPIKGISLNKVEEYYWEEIKDHGNKYIKYYLKYPFSTGELNGLIQEYETINRKWTNELETVTKKNSYSNFEDLLKDIEQLKYLSDKLPNQKSVEARKRGDLLEEWADDVSISSIEVASGKIRYQLMLYDQPITTSEKPEIFASCKVKITSVKEYPDQVIILYEPQNCFQDDKRNYITVRYDLDGYFTSCEFIILK